MRRALGFLIGVALVVVFGILFRDGSRVAASQPTGQAKGARAVQDPGPALEKPPLPRSESEKKILAVIEEVGTKQRQGNMLVPIEDGRLLRILTESIGAKHVVELGTSVGYSGLWFALALRTTGGKLTTFEIDARRTAQARSNFQRAGVDGLITLVEGDAHVEVTKVKEPIDLLFLDADKEGYLDYLNKLLPLVRPGGLIVAHNMRRPPPDPRYVEAITNNPNLETVFLNMHAAGVGVTIKKR
ncbi:MAG: O-methyltransferase [Gemmataceae bacterium]|nr:O-methyltransferase [Gemmataceae bacterium]